MHNATILKNGHLCYVGGSLTESLFVFGRLFQEFCVMAFAKIDTQRLRFFRLNDTDVGHDYEECDDSQHCAQCCALGHCTSKNPYSRQGQCEADEGMYFPCVVCEPEYNGHPQVERLPLGAAEAVLDPSKKTKKLEPQAYDAHPRRRIAKQCPSDRKPPQRTRHAVEYTTRGLVTRAVVHTTSTN